MYRKLIISKCFTAICMLSFGFFSCNTFADDVYDSATNQLFIPLVQVGNETFYNVVITVGELVSVGGLSDASEKTYNLQSMYEALVKNSATVQFSLKGSVSGYNVSGYGSQTSGKLSSTVFEGKSALVKTANATFSFNIDGEVVPSAASGQAYYDTNYNFLGYSGEEFELVTNRAPFPTAARKNDAGVLYNSTIYTTSQKRTIIGYETTSYSIAYDSESSVILTIISVRKDLAGAISQTVSSLYRVTNDNIVTRLLDTLNDSTMFLTISY